MIVYKWMIGVLPEHSSIYLALGLSVSVVYRLPDEVTLFNDQLVILTSIYYCMLIVNYTLDFLVVSYLDC